MNPSRANPARTCAASARSWLLWLMNGTRPTVSAAGPPDYGPMTTGGRFNVEHARNAEYGALFHGLGSLSLVT